MRSGWGKPTPQTISSQQIGQMCMMVFGSADYNQATPLTAGRSHQNHLLTLNNGMQVVLRIGSNKQNLKKQYALAQKLWRQLPVPRFISTPQQTDNQKYFVFLEFKQGERLENLEKLPLADQAQLGFELGEYLALMHSQTFKTAGEFDTDLQVTETYDISPNGLNDMFKNLLKQAVTNGYISTSQSQKYSTQFEMRIKILNEWQHTHCLIHADLNEDNILQNNGHISAMLDWEFTLSGHPALDFGKFTRTPYCNCPIFLENLCNSYYLTHKSLPANWDEIAAVTDLIAWAQFLSRQNLNSDVKISAIAKLKSVLGG